MGGKFAAVVLGGEVAMNMGGSKYAVLLRNARNFWRMHGSNVGVSKSLVDQVSQDDS